MRSLALCDLVSHTPFVLAALRALRADAFCAVQGRPVRREGVGGEHVAAGQVAAGHLAVGVGEVGGEQGGVDLASEVALEAADDLGSGQALGGAADGS
jgi:hypothetical protein